MKGDPTELLQLCLHGAQGQAEKQKHKPSALKIFLTITNWWGLRLIYYLCYLMGFEAVYIREKFCGEYMSLDERSCFLQGHVGVSLCLPHLNVWEKYLFLFSPGPQLLSQYTNTTILSDVSNWCETVFLRSDREGGMNNDWICYALFSNIPPRGASWHLNTAQQNRQQGGDKHYWTEDWMSDQ